MAEPESAISAGRDPVDAEPRNLEELERTDRGSGVPESRTTSTKHHVSQVAQLLEIAKAIDLFCTPTREAYARVPVDSHREIWPIESGGGLEDWLQRQFWERTGEAPKESSVRDSLRSLRGRARNGGEVSEVHVRVAERHGAIYHDLGNQQWQAVETSSDGWRLVSDPPIDFRRGSSALPAACPTRGGSLDPLRRFLHVGCQEDWRLLIGWLIAALTPWPPYAVLVLAGEQDSAKSTTSKVLRALVDPDDAPLTPAPRDVEELLVVARDNWLPVFDNLSHLDVWCSDALCRLSDGGALKRRARYTDTALSVVKAARPVILNGIGELATRGDLLSRALIITLPPILDRDRVDERALWTDFNQTKPEIAGALYDLLAGVIAHLPTVSLPAPPRMATFARVGTAVEHVLGWPAGSFLDAYRDSRREASEISLDTWPVAPALLGLLAEKGSWEGRATDLLTELQGRTDEAPRLVKSWPKLAHHLSAQLTRHAPSLRSQGWEVSKDRSGKTGERVIRIRRQSIESSVSSVRSDAVAADAGADRGLGLQFRAGDSRKDQAQLTLADAHNRVGASAAYRIQTGSPPTVADAVDAHSLSFGRRGERRTEASQPPATECRCGAFDWESRGAWWRCRQCGSRPWYEVTAH